MTAQETGTVTGTKDKDYNLIWYVEACLGNALRLETYIQDATREGDSELADLFRKAQADSRKGAEMGKKLLRARGSRRRRWAGCILGGKAPGNVLCELDQAVAPPAADLGVSL